MNGDDNIPDVEDEDDLEFLDIGEEDKEMDNLIELKISDESPALDVADLLLPNIKIGTI